MPFEIVPQEDAWIKQAKKNLTALYENRPMERMPFEFRAYDITGEFKPKMPLNSPVEKTIEQVRGEFFDPERPLKGQLGEIASRVREGYWDDTIYGLHPISGATGWLTEIFGAKTEWFANRPPYPHPVISEVKEIDHLKPDFNRSELYKAAIDHMRYFRKVVGDRIPILTPDLQSPIDAASMIFDYTQLVYAMMDEPQRVHALMGMVTEALIRACHEFKKEMNSDFPVTHFNWWLPRGAFFSDDLQAVLNAELYREFATPYNEMISREFGGLALHSCGRILHNIDNVCSTRGLMGFNTHDTLAKIAPIVKNRAVPIVGGIFEVMAPNHPDGKRPFLKSADELEEFWWRDFERMTAVKGQRFLYQCHALLSKRKGRETYDRILALSRETIKGLSWS